MIPEFQYKQMPELLTPSSVIECYNNALKVDIEATPVKVQGIYQPDTANRIYNDYYYDNLIEEGSNETLVMKVKPVLREKLISEKGKLVAIVGVLSRKVQSRSALQILFTPTFILSVKESTVSSEEIRLAELTANKAKTGFKGVKLLIRQTLFENRKPTVALLWSTQSVVRTEYSNALGAASKYYNFVDINTTFSNVRETVAKLRELDGKYDMIALIRGGGSSLEVFSNPDLIEAVVTMKSAVISAVGHAEEKHHLKKVADLTIDTPTALGKFFSDVVEEVIDERSKSKAILREEVKKEFNELVNKQTSQIKQLQEQNNNLSAEIKTQTSERIKQGHSLNNIEISLKQKDKEYKVATDRITELTDQLQKASLDINKKISESTTPLVSQINRLTEEADSHSKEIVNKGKELAGYLQELESLRSRPQGITTGKVALIATCTFLAGLLLTGLIA